MNFNNNSFIVSKINNEYEFYYIKNITNKYLIVKKLKKDIKYKLDNNERLYKVVDMIYNFNYNNEKGHNRIYINSFDKYESYNNNFEYIENV